MYFSSQAQQLWLLGKLRREVRDTMKTQTFGNKRQAESFAKDVKGFVEGPFIDDKLHSNYIVFYRGGKTHG